MSEEFLEGEINKLKNQIENREYQTIDENSDKSEIQLHLAQQLYLTKLEGELYNLRLKQQLKKMTKCQKISLIGRNIMNYIYINTWLKITNPIKAEFLLQHSKLYKNANYLSKKED